MAGRAKSASSPGVAPLLCRPAACGGGQVRAGAVGVTHSHPQPSYSALACPGGPGAGAGEWAPAEAAHGLAGLGTLSLQH